MAHNYYTSTRTQHQKGFSTTPSHPSAKRTHLSPLHRLIFALWDHAWRHYYNLISTFGISVMEPWERVFVLSLTVALVSLFGIAAVKIPACVAYLGGRMAYYLFGSAEVAVGAAQGSNFSAAAVTADAAARMARVEPMQMDVPLQTICQQALTSGLLTLGGKDTAGVQPGWTVAS